MTTRLASTIRCSGCEYVAEPGDPFPFRCPRAGTDQADHVLTRVLDLAVARFPTAPFNSAPSNSSGFENEPRRVPLSCERRMSLA